MLTKVLARIIQDRMLLERGVKDRIGFAVKVKSEKQYVKPGF